MSVAPANDSGILPHPGSAQISRAYEVFAFRISGAWQSDRCCYHALGPKSRLDSKPREAGKTGAAPISNARPTLVAPLPKADARSASFRRCRLRLSSCSASLSRFLKHPQVGTTPQTVRRPRRSRDTRNGYCHLWTSRARGKCSSRMLSMRNVPRRAHAARPPAPLNPEFPGLNCRMSCAAGANAIRVAISLRHATRPRQLKVAIFSPYEQHE